MSATMTATDPCPPWCELPAGHDLEPEVLGRQGARFHHVEIGDVDIFATQMLGEDGVLLPTETPGIACDIRLEEASAADARALAADLQRAADRLDEMTSAARKAVK